MAIGCQQYRACHRGSCPVGIATQDRSPRSSRHRDRSAAAAGAFLTATTAMISRLRPNLRSPPTRRSLPEDLASLDLELARETELEWARRTGQRIGYCEQITSSRPPGLHRMAAVRNSGTDGRRRGQGLGRIEPPAIEVGRWQRPWRPDARCLTRTDRAGLGRARQPLPAPGRPARRRADRERLRHLPVARLRVRPLHRRSPRRASATPRPPTRVEERDDGLYVELPVHRRARVPRWTRSSTTSATGASTRCSGWSATPTSGWPTPPQGRGGRPPRVRRHPPRGRGGIRRERATPS